MKTWKEIFAGIDLFEIRIDRLQQLIDIMERVDNKKKNFNISFWQDTGRYSISKTEQELTECGTAACVGGWLAVSPEFKASGGKIQHGTGCPIIKSYEASDAVQYFLTGRKLIPKSDNRHLGHFLSFHTGAIYRTDKGRCIKKVTAKNVLVRLRHVMKRITPSAN